MALGSLCLVLSLFSLASSALQATNYSDYKSFGNAPGTSTVSASLDNESQPRAVDTPLAIGSTNALYFQKDYLSTGLQYGELPRSRRKTGVSTYSYESVPNRIMYKQDQDLPSSNYTTDVLIAEPTYSASKVPDTSLADSSNIAGVLHRNPTRQEEKGHPDQVEHNPCVHSESRIIDISSKSVHRLSNDDSERRRQTGGISHGFDVERLKFWLVFIFWPTMMGVTMAL